MPLYWLALAVSIVVVIVSAIYTTRKGLEAFRAAKVLGNEVSTETARIEQASAQIERHLALAAESGARLDAELAQLRRSRARLNVLTSAIADVKVSITSLTDVYPRK